MSVAENVATIRDRIAAACARSNRNPSDVLLIGVSKTVAADRVRQAVAAGISDLGENRVQEALEKAAVIGAGPAWHLIGHLQSNKAKKAAGLFSWVHSVDSVAIATDLSRHAAEAGRTLSVLVELNLVGEAQRTGLDPARLDEAISEIRRLRNLSLRGLMTMAPFTEDHEAVRRCFRELRETLGRARAQHGLSETFRELSMGMTGDFEIAIEEGSTMVRVGRALFGERA